MSGCDRCQCAACAKYKTCHRKKCWSTCDGKHPIRTWKDALEKPCAGFVRDPYRFVYQLTPGAEYQYIYIRILREPSGLIPEYIPRVGEVYLAMLGLRQKEETRKYGDPKWCILPIGDKKIILKNLEEQKEYELISRF